MPGAKKGAHYSALMPFGTSGARRLAAGVLALMVLGSAPLPAARAAPPETDAHKAEAELQAVKAEIERITRQVSAEQVERDRLTHELRSSELSVGKLRDSLSEVRRERAERAARRAALAAEQREREAEVQHNRAALAGQLRAAYLIGRQEPLKLLLNQKDPALVGRMFAYYSYFGRARAGQIKLIEDDMQRIAETQRTHVLASLEAQSHTRAQNLERLRSQQAGLEKLLRELRTAMERFPLEGNDAFARLRGKLAWPVSGRLVARFGDARAGGVRWDGVLVATERGAPVKAVCQGRVIYADWLPGLGLLTIVDHGDGYLSLYGHNERLYKAAGEPVASGEPIAAAGDSGGSSRPELYFEIRKGGKPVDPRPWFRASAP